MRSLGSLAQSQLLQDFVQLMPEPVQTPLSHLADGFGYLEDFQAGSTAPSLQCHSGSQQEDLELSSVRSELFIHSRVSPGMINGGVSAPFLLAH